MILGFTVSLIIGSAAITLALAKKGTVLIGAMLQGLSVCAGLLCMGLVISYSFLIRESMHSGDVEIFIGFIPWITLCACIILGFAVCAERGRPGRWGIFALAQWKLWSIYLGFIFAIIVCSLTLLFRGMIAPGG